MPYSDEIIQYCWGCHKNVPGWYVHPRTGLTSGRYCRVCYLARRKGGVTDSYRDTQKSRVYQSEWSVKEKHEMLRIPDLETAQEMVDVMTQNRWYPEQFPDGYRRVRVISSKRGSSHAWGGHGQITLPAPPKGKWAWTDIVLVHELAHNANSSGPPHGPEFTSALLRLTRKFIPELFEPLLSQYDARRVRVSATTFDRRAV